MKRQFWRNHPRPLNNNPWASHPSASRTIGAMAMLVIGLVLLSPAGAQAAAAIQGVFIADPTDSTRRAHVDGSGNLQVTGNMTLSGTPTVNAQQTDRPLQSDEPGRYPYRDALNLSGGHGFIPVPAGKRLVVRYISGHLTVTGGAVPVNMVIYQTVQIVPIKIASLAPVDYYNFSQNTEFYLDGGTSYNLFVQYSTGAPEYEEGVVYIVGYLIDCLSSPCGTEAVPPFLS